MKYFSIFHLKLLIRGKQKQNKTKGRKILWDFPRYFDNKKMEGRHDLPNPNIVSGLPRFSLIFFEQIYSSLNTKIPPTMLSVPSPDPPPPQQFQQLLWYSWDVLLFLLLLLLAEGGFCCHPQSNASLHQQPPAALEEVAVDVAATWSDPSVRLSVPMDFDGHNTGYEMGPAVAIYEKQQLPVRSALSRSRFWGP